MSQELIVANSVGQRDLQVLALDDKEQLCRVSPSKNDVRVMHQAILNNSLRYQLWLPQDESFNLQESKNVDALWQNGVVCFNREGFKCAQAEHLPGASASDKADVWLVPGLLWRALRELEAELQNGEYQLKRVVIFYSQRDDDHYFARSEPIGAHEVLARWLQQYLGMPKESIECVRYLEAMEDLTIRDELGNSYLLPNAAQRVQTALHRADQDFPKAHCRLCISAGIPEVSDIVQAAAEFYFTGRLQYRSPSEDRHKPVSEELPFAFVPVEVLHARRRCRDLILHGQFEAAGVLAESFRPFPKQTAQTWRACIAAVARYIQGYMNLARKEYKELQDCRMVSALGQILKEDHPQSLHVAMRIESALRAENVLRAAAWTSTFKDVALLDAIDAVLRKDPNQSCVAWESRTVIRDALCIDKHELRDTAKSLKDPPNEDEIARWLKKNSLGLRAAWQEKTMREAIRQKGREDLCNALFAYAEALYPTTEERKKPARYRNMIIHSVLSQEELEFAFEVFSNNRLWIKQKGSYSFLERSSRAAAVLKALGVVDALTYYQDLVAALVFDIESCPLV